MPDFKKCFRDANFHGLQINIIVQFLNTERAVLLSYFYLVYLLMSFLISFCSFPNSRPFFLICVSFETTVSSGYLYTILLYKQNYVQSWS